MKQLHLTFLNEEQKNTVLKPKVAREDLTGDEVKSMMTKICELGIFHKDGLAVYNEPMSAHYTETIVTDLF